MRNGRAVRAILVVALRRLGTHKGRATADDDWHDLFAITL